MSAPLLFDRVLHRRRLDRAARVYDAAAFLKQRVAADAVDRLETATRGFPLAAELGARTGAFAEALEASPARAMVGRLFEADLSLCMLAGRDGVRLVLDEERLPFAPASLDLVVSLLALHWTNDLPGALIQIRRALKPDGLFVGAIFGGATLTELRQSLLQAEAELRGGAGLRVSPFADGGDAAGLLQRAGFALPVTDVDRVTVRYAHPLRLLSDLRRMGETNVLLDRDRRPLSRAVLARACDVYAERFGDADGRIPATFEIIAVTGWAPVRPGDRVAAPKRRLKTTFSSSAPSDFDGSENSPCPSWLKGVARGLRVRAADLAIFGVLFSSDVQASELNAYDPSHCRLALSFEAVLAQRNKLYEHGRSSESLALWYEFQSRGRPQPSDAENTRLVRRMHADSKLQKMVAKACVTRAFTNPAFPAFWRSRGQYKSLLFP